MCSAVFHGAKEKQNLKYMASYPQCKLAPTIQIQIRKGVERLADHHTPRRLCNSHNIGKSGSASKIRYRVTSRSNNSTLRNDNMYFINLYDSYDNTS